MMKAFNIRVYGILINEEKQILLADELVRGMKITKFPGGGLEPGEGTRDCLRREFMEELALTVEVGEHLYTTDFYQQSAFNPEHQIISIYYFVRPLGVIDISVATETESFRFINWDEFTDDSVTLPIDKIVASLLKEKHLPV